MRGERERVADRVRQLLGVPPPDDGPAPRWRWDPGHRGAMAVGAAVVLVVAVLLWWLTASRPQAVPVSSLDASSAAAVAVPSGSGTAAAPATASAAVTASATSATSDVLVVDVAGKVVHPGIYRLPAGSRVFDAVQAAGGARPGVDLVSINLAAPLQDGQQVVVGMPGAAPTQPGAPATASGGSTVPSVVDLNTATLEQLETLPGVGPVLGQHILDWRDAHQHFASVDQLNEVSGIGDVRFAQLKSLVTV